LVHLQLLFEWETRKYVFVLPPYQRQSQFHGGDLHLDVEVDSNGCLTIPSLCLHNILDITWSLEVRLHFDFHLSTPKFLGTMQHFHVPYPLLP
jgi:hypothetical protein